MTATDTVAQIMASRAADRIAAAEAKYRKIVDALAAGGDKDVDAEATAITCETLGRTPADLRADVSRKMERIAMAETAKTWLDHLVAKQEAIDYHERHKAETLAIIAARKEGDQLAYEASIQAAADATQVDAALARLAKDDPLPLRTRAAELGHEARTLVRDRILAKRAVQAAEAVIATAKAAGRKKNEMGEEIAAAESAKIELDLVDGLLDDWREKWAALTEERLSLPPLPPEPPRPLHNPYGPGFPA